MNHETKPSRPRLLSWIASRAQLDEHPACAYQQRDRAHHARPRSLMRRIGRRIDHGLYGISGAAAEEFRELAQKFPAGEGGVDEQAGDRHRHQDERGDGKDRIERNGRPQPRRLPVAPEIVRRPEIVEHGDHRNV
jgi:hypothetical protein